MGNGQAPGSACTATFIGGYQTDAFINIPNTLQTNNEKGGPGNPSFFGNSLRTFKGDSYEMKNACLQSFVDASTIVGPLGNGFCKANGEFSFQGFGSRCDTLTGVGCDILGITLNPGICPGNNCDSGRCALGENQFRCCGSPENRAGCMTRGQNPICLRNDYTFNDLELFDRGFICAADSALTNNFLVEYFFPDGGSPKINPIPSSGPYQNFFTCNPNLDLLTLTSNSEGNLAYNSFCSNPEAVLPSFRYFKRFISQNNVPQLSDLLFFSGGIKRIESEICQRFIFQQLGNIALNQPVGTYAESAANIMNGFCTGNNGKNLSNVVCQQFYQAFPAQANINANQKEIMNFCTTGNNMENSQVGEFCQNVVSLMINESKNTGFPIIDNSLTQYCTENKGVTLSNLATQDILLQDICACHLSAQDMANAEASLKEEFPGLNVASLGNIKCLVKLCASSRFPSSSTAPEGSCPGANCIQIIVNEFESTFTGEVINDQSGACVGLNKNINSSSDLNIEPIINQSTAEQAQNQQNTALIVGISVPAALVILTIIVLGILFGLKILPLNSKDPIFNPK